MRHLSFISMLFVTRLYWTTATMNKNSLDGCCTWDTTLECQYWNRTVCHASIQRCEAPDCGGAWLVKSFSRRTQVDNSSQPSDSPSIYVDVGTLPPSESPFSALPVSSNGTLEDICVSPTGTYTVKVDLYAGELGYFMFEECGDAVNPTIGMEIGETYVFSQSDRTNYYHPMGFAYFPDGAHNSVDELEPGVLPPGSTNNCDLSGACPAPMYFLNGIYLGNYSNDPSVKTPTANNSYFGLDDYEPLFFHAIPEWVGYGAFHVQLRFDDDSYQKDIFYFCHIHNLMTGRIKLLKNGVPVQPDVDLPEIPYQYDKVGPFDEQCGTYGLEDWQLPNDQCLERFVCDVPENDTGLRLFADCIDAMDCHMMAGMTTDSSSDSAIALFIHQMVPHHQNAVNMAKATLKTNKLTCDDLTSESDDCVMESILYEIVNSQNFQIQAMYAIAEDLGFNRTDDCKVIIDPPPPLTLDPVHDVTPGPSEAPVDNSVQSSIQGGASASREILEGMPIGMMLFLALSFVMEL